MLTAARPHLITVNAGSSSLKLALFTCDAEPQPVGAGEVAAIGAGTGDTHATAAERFLKMLEARVAGGEVVGIVHRIVHGGEHFDRAVQITQEVRDALDQLVPLAPNHLPDSLNVVDALARARPKTPQIACFDTAFHRTLPEVSRTLAVPSSPGLRRYGFHGLSYAFLLSALERTVGTAVARGRVVLAHLGNGSSLAAVFEGRSVDTTMGLTPAGGLVMSSRSGDLDPSVVTYLARANHLNADGLDHLLSHESGLLALSGLSPSMEILLAAEATDPRARLAVEVFCYQVTKGIGGFAAALGGLETLVFAGGIGEHSSQVRARACAPLAFLGVRLDPARNEGHAAVISASDSRVTVRVIPTDEGLMMAREARGVLA